MPLKCPRRPTTLHWFERFTDLNLFKYAFNVIQKWESDALQFYSIVKVDVAG